MKLTNYMRDAFVRAAMQDVPCLDYGEQIRKAMQAAALDAMPPKMRALLKDPACEAWVNTEWVSLPSISGHRVYCPRDSNKGEYLAAADREHIAWLRQAEKQQLAKREDLERKLRNVAYSVNTRKALADALPEFVKYLPPDDSAAVKTLPAVANVVADFVKAGWPKGKKPAAVA